MAKKDFRGISSLLTGTVQNTPEQTAPETPDFLQPKAKKQSENKILQASKGYYRKTFLMDADLGRMVEAWSLYKKFRDKSFSEKQIADEALRAYFANVDQNELQKAIDLFK